MGIINKKNSILLEIVDYKKTLIDNLYNEVGLDSLKKKSAENDTMFQAFSFSKALSEKGLNLIAEVKKASPSKGIINPDFKPLNLATDYVGFGAKALSVLTEDRYFLGSNAILNQVSEHVSVPLLRKDFMLDPIQVYEAKTYGASAILIILAILSVEQAQTLLDTAQQCGLDVLIEIHDDADVEKLYQLKNVKIIGINNRNLNSFEVDIQTANHYYAQLKQDFDTCLFVAESGYDDFQQCKDIEMLGFNAVLIGEGLVTSKSLITYFSHES